MTAGETTPPANLHAEQALLGACMVNPDALDDVADKITERDFYRSGHGEIFAGLVTLRDKGQPTDPVSLAHHLGDRVQRLGGLSHLHDLMASVVVGTNAGYFAEIIIEQALRRGLQQAGTRALQLAHTEADDAADLIERARESFDELTARTATGDELIEIGDLAEDALDRYASPAPPSLPTGLHDLDAVLSGGLWPGTMTVIGARPGNGKSIVGGVIALNAALHGKGALFLSLEMTKAEITDRLISHLSSVRLWNITNHRLADQDWDGVTRAADRMRSMPLAIVDEPHMGVAGIRSRARERMRTPLGLSLIVVDQLNLIRPATARTKREEEVAELSRSLKLLAKELRIPIVVLHQLNREPEKRGGKPQLADLRESGMVEAHSDIAILLHPQPEDDARGGEIDFIVAKNRQGPQTVITMAWQPHYARVGDLSRREY